MSYFVVGAYASQPGDDAGQRAYYDALAATGWVDGLEVPFPGQFDRPEFLAELLTQRFTHSVLTAIPGTMVNVWENPNFGLGSPDETGRQLALSFTRRAYEAVQQVHESAGHVFDWVALHSAPTQLSTPDAFTRSLEEISGWDWGATGITIEHCDERSEEHEPEKGFLLLQEELEIAAALGVHVSLNWGRSAVGSRGATAPVEHIRQAAASGRLAGVIFSGASPHPTQYGPAWIDGHLPLQTDEPASLMTAEQVHAGTRAAGTVAYLGAKCCVPAAATIAQRVTMISNIYQATHSASV